MHGTGTKAGDRCEMTSVTDVYGQRGGLPLHVGSVKANIGHAEAAAGFAGLTKLLGMFRYRQIPPQISLKALNPELRDIIGDSRIVINTEVRPWETAEVKEGVPVLRTALLNSFGAAGSNASLLLQEWKTPGNKGVLLTEPEAKGPGYLFCLSAKTSKALVTLCSMFLKFLQQNPDIDGRQMCFASSARRIHQKNYRVAFEVPNDGNVTFLQRGLQRVLSQIEDGKAPKKLPMRSPNVLIMLQGETPSLKTLHYHISTEPSFSKEFKLLLEELSSTESEQIRASLFDTDDSQNTSLQFTASLLLTFIFEIAIVRRWQAWGLRNISLVITSSISQAVSLVLKEKVTAIEAWEQLDKSCPALESNTPAKEDLNRTDMNSSSHQISKNTILLGKGCVAIAPRDEDDLLSAEHLLSDESYSIPATTCQMLAKLYEAGATLDFRTVFSAESYAAVPYLPNHSFELERFWVPFHNECTPFTPSATFSKIAEAEAKKSRAFAYTINYCKQHSKDTEMWAYAMEVTSVRDEIMGHMVAGQGMCPASIYHEFALTSLAFHLNLQEGCIPKISNVRYISPLLYDESDPGTLICQLTALPDNDRAFLARISSKKQEASNLTPHFYGQVSLQKNLHIAPNSLQNDFKNDLTADVAKSTRSSQHTLPIIETQELYAGFAEDVVQYSPLYQSIAAFSIMESKYEAIASIKTDFLSLTSSDGVPYVFSPILQDTLLVSNALEGIYILMSSVNSILSTPVAICVTIVLKPREMLLSLPNLSVRWNPRLDLPMWLESQCACLGMRDKRH